MKEATGGSADVNIKRRIHQFTMPVIVLVAFGGAASGCGIPASAPTPNSGKQAVKPAIAAFEAPAEEQIYLKKEHYEGSIIKPQQIDLLNRLFNAQNAGDAQTYASLFTQEAPEKDKRIIFRVDKAERFDGFKSDSDQTEIDPVGGAIRENAADGYHSILYNFKQEAGEWRIAGIERANGTRIDESGYEEDELELAKLIQAKADAQNAGDAEAYRSLFIPGSIMGELHEDAPRIEELQIMKIDPPSTDTSIAQVAYRVEGDKQVRSNAFIFVRREGKWLLYDID